MSMHKKYFFVEKEHIIIILKAFYFVYLRKKKIFDRLKRILFMHYIGDFFVTPIHK